MFLKLIISSSLTIITVTAYIVPIHYNIMLTSYIENHTFFGLCNISVEIFEPMRRIKLYSKVTNITEVTVFNDPPKIVNEPGYKPINKAIYGNVIIEYLFNELPSGNYTLKLKFVNIITNIEGLSIFHDRNKQWLGIYFDAIGIRNLFPYFHEFSIVTLEISIEHDDENYGILSNIPMQKEEINNKNMTITYFEITLEMPKYLLFLNNFNLTSSINKSVIVNMWCITYCVSAHKVAKEMTLYLFNKLNRLYKTWEINHVAIPDFQDNDIINENLLIYSETNIFYENINPRARIIQVALFVAHKVVQECFYYKNPHWSSFFWLNEAIITFLKYYIMNQVMPDTEMIYFFVVQIQHESLHFDTKYNTSLYNTSLSSFESPRYIRASSVLRMLQNMVTKQIFWKIIRMYVKSNDPSPDYFHKVVKNLMLSPRNRKYLTITTITAIKQLINYWINHKYCLVMKVIRDYNDSMLSIKIWIVNFNTHTAPDYYLPVTYTTQTYHNFIYKSTMLLNQWPFQKKFDFEENGWILFNIKQTGYYRVNYDIENWRRIASYLDSKNYINIHVLNRAQIIDDAFHLMITYQLNSTVFWNVAKYLKRETEYIPWHPTFKALEYLSNVFLFRGTRFSNIKGKIQNLLYKVLEKLGYDEVPSNQSSLRLEAAKWACSLDERTCIDNAKLKLNRHLEDPEKNELLPFWEEWTYCHGLKTLLHPLSNENSSWWRVYYLGKEKFKTKFLKFLACPKDSNFTRDYLNLIKNNNTSSKMFFEDFSDQDYINYFLLTIAKHARNPAVLDFTLQNLENIKPKQISEYVAFTVIINHVYSTNQLQKINDSLTDKFFKVTQVESNECKKLWFFVKERNTKVKTLDLTEFTENTRCMQQYISNIKSKIQVRSFEIESQQNYFENFVKYQ